MIVDAMITSTQGDSIMQKFSYELLAKTVRQARTARNLTQSELAKQTGINRSLIGRIEN